MTDELKTILDELDTLQHDPDYAEDFCCEECGALITFCEARLFIITEDDWNAIEARGYDLHDWRREFDESFENTDRNKTVALRIWQKLCKVPFDEETNEIKEFFRGYPVGTDRFEIWSDLEDDFGVNVKRDFMHLEKTEEEKEFVVRCFFDNDSLVRVKAKNESEAFDKCLKAFRCGDERIAPTQDPEINFEIAEEFWQNVVNENPEEFPLLDDKEKGETKEMKSTNDRNMTPDMLDERNFMVSNGSYINFWDTMGHYDVFLCFHECELNTHEDICEFVVRQIMEHRKVNDTRETLTKRIHDALDAMVEWEYREPYVFIGEMKGEN